MNIGAIGRNKARNVFNIISDMFYGEKDKVHNGLVPMDMVLEYFCIPKLNVASINNDVNI